MRLRSRRDDIALNEQLCKIVIMTALFANTVGAVLEVSLTGLRSVTSIVCIACTVVYFGFYLCDYARLGISRFAVVVVLLCGVIEFPVLFFFYGSSRIIYYCLPCVAIGLFFDVKYRHLSMVAYTVFNIVFIIVCSYTSPYISSYDRLTYYGEIISFFIVAVSLYFMSSAANRWIVEQSNMLEKSNEDMLRAQTLVETNLTLAQIDLDTDSFEIIYVLPGIESVLGDCGRSAQNALFLSADKLCTDLYRARLKSFYDVPTIRERLQDKSIISCEFYAPESGWCRASFIPAKKDNEGRISQVIFSVEKIDDEILTLRDKLDIDDKLLECVRTMNTEKDPKASILKLLSIIANYHNSDRAYLFTLDKDKRTIRAAYEWCEPGAIHRSDYDGDVIFEAITYWYEMGEHRCEVKFISGKDELKNIHPDYVLEELELENMVTYPVLDSDGTIIGVMGMDNVRTNFELKILIETVALILMEELAHVEYTRKLYELSYKDKMTGVDNRHAYLRDMQILNDRHAKYIGVDQFAVPECKQ